MTKDLTSSQLLDIAKQFGTPVYVYNADKISSQYQKLKQAFKSQNVQFFYASKALTNVSILKHIKSIGSNVDCSSINEVKLALHAGFARENILYTSNSISFSEIIEAADLGVHINIDSISNLEKFGKKYQHSYPVGIRWRPNILAGGNLKISTGHDRSKFGIPVDQIDKVLKIVEDNNMHIQTIHIHTGSEIKEVEIFAKGIEILFQLSVYFPELEIIDLGGGFKVPYQENDSETDITLLSEKVEELFSNHFKKTGKNYQIWFEPGKYLVSEAGYFLAQVNVLKPTTATIFAGINTGFNHLVRPMFYDAYHRIENLSNVDGDEKNYSIVGNICETDTFAWERKMAEISEGDYLVFYNAGAYGFEMASNFNSRFKPAEIMVKDGKTMLIRKADTFEDLLRNQVEAI
ncbi:MAG: diaminopimelate decarboxylase [Ginsengibacter sp.]